jgi:hypothetical protein
MSRIFSFCRSGLSCVLSKEGNFFHAGERGKIRRVRVDVEAQAREVGRNLDSNARSLNAQGKGGGRCRGQGAGVAEIGSTVKKQYNHSFG